MDAGVEWMVAIDPVPFTVGRGDECNLKLTDKWISRRHSEIRRSGDHLWIRDLGSTNGTFLNHKRIGQAELIEPDDMVSIGKFKLRVKCVESNGSTIAEETCAMDSPQDFAYLASLEPRLRALLQERSVIPYYQPVLKLADLTLAGYEILGRVGIDELPTSPAELFDLAEWLGCAADLSELFREVGLDIGRQLGGTPLFFVNTAPSEMDRMSDLLQSLERIHTLAPLNRIVLEINEKTAQHNGEIIRLREALGKLNIALAFDDFGVGQTRLVELAKAPPDFLKFDISLIREIHLAPKRLHQMVATFVKASQDLGIATVAEGIECQDEAETCRQLGFNFAQGFFYGRPLPIHEIR